MCQLVNPTWMSVNVYELNSTTVLHKITIQITSNNIEELGSAKHLSDFLHAEELQQNALVKVQKDSLNIGNKVLSIKGSKFHWNKQDMSAALEDINLTVQKGELTEGEVALFGNVAYAAQNPWYVVYEALLACWLTVQDNILFSHEYDEVFYNLVIEACALKPDLELLPQGDLTEVSKKGITLSGGQCVHVMFAHAIYACSDLILLWLLSIPMLPDMSLIMLSVLKACSQPKHAFLLLTAFHISIAVTLQSSNMATPTTSEGDEDMQATLVGGLECVSEKVLCRESFKKAILTTPPKLCNASSDGIMKEHSEQGHIKMEVYLQYLHAASRKGFLFFVLAMVLQQVVSVTLTMMLRLWGEHNRKMGTNIGLTNKCCIWSCMYHSAFLRQHQQDSAPDHILNLFSYDIYVVDQILVRVIQNMLCYLPSTAVNQWLAVRLEFVGAVIIFVTAVLAVSAIVTSDVDVGLVNLVLSYALNMTGSLMLQKPREKIRICGQTGAGKSSLLLTLFQIIKSASGTIFIDKVDITKLGLHDYTFNQVHSAISMVPQSPDLFEGTLQENINPAGKHQDVHPKTYIKSLPGGLDALVQEAGSSLSAGQRQLLCFMRVLLCKTKVLILNEEFDMPKKLLEHKSSIFHSMAMEAGLVQVQLDDAEENA
ncbi:uncharacterized protein BJ212DRAFT_1526346 [Suillus subaureus]|uniref:ABC transporter domain-containing protein n=1 Tax=Suillus subaureus TaxID=48587 RepID=A0A9P7ASQ9_9AGAM|nr:uncharacterized protein BJ212DRAFT_1526346 [Suillus subaureus]KAG1795561.1 hypothetical protein BJ212DRAFT_1526346 [Suillus subaureus]